VLLAAGGAALTPEGEPVTLVPDTEAKIRLVAASSEEAAHALLRAVADVDQVT
jgi:3'(2'), 5'-bisphosphate nucleotidase